MLKAVKVEFKLECLSAKIITKGLVQGYLLTKPPVTIRSSKLPNLLTVSKEKALLRAFSGHCETPRMFVDSSDMDAWRHTVIQSASCYRQSAVREIGD